MFFKACFIKKYSSEFTELALWFRVYDRVNFKFGIRVKAYRTI